MKPLAAPQEALLESVSSCQVELQVGKFFLQYGAEAATFGGGESQAAFRWGDAVEEFQEEGKFLPAELVDPRSDINAQFDSGFPGGEGVCGHGRVFFCVPVFPLFFFFAFSLKKRVGDAVAEFDSLVASVLPNEIQAHLVSPSSQEGCQGAFSRSIRPATDEQIQK